MRLSWLSAFIDLPGRPPGRFERACAFWEAVTGSALSAPRGELQQFYTLKPPEGDAFLKVQRTSAEASGCHLDLHVDDPARALERAKSLGAAPPPGGGVLGLSSPAGLAFCLVANRAEHGHRPPPQTWPGGARSLVDQLCIDVPAPAFEAECAFWAALTGWELRPGSRPEFSYLVRPPSLPLRLLLQRLGDDGRACAGAHLDLACDDVAAEAERHKALGAAVVREMPNWTALADPAGLAYCVTRRNPGTGQLA